MSPEQVRGEAVDSRTDVFSFGLVLYEMATGQRAFPGNTLAVVHDAILNREILPAWQVNPEIPSDLALMIGKAMEKDRNLR
jgi:eukaryotic-like serine/threonine-protein kinase